MSSKKDKAKALLLGCLFSVLILVIAEVAARSLWIPLNRAQIKRLKAIIPNPVPLPHSEYQLPDSLAQLPRFEPADSLAPTSQLDQQFDLFEHDGDYSTLIKNHSGRMFSKLSASGQTVFDVQAHVDEHGRRRSFERPRPQAREHLLLMGCSFTFGDGLPDSESLPWQINLLQANATALNLGFSGSSAPHFWVGAFHKDIFSGIAPARGAAVYIFKGDHLTRALGAASLSDWGQERESVESVEGRLQWTGTFKKAHPWRTAFYRVLWRSYFFRLLGLDLPPLTQARYDEFVQIISEIRDRYLEKFGSENRFVFVIYPNRFVDRYNLDRLILSLNKYKIPFLNYGGADLSELVEGAAGIPYDGHPNVKANRVMAELLIKDLKLDSARAGALPKSDAESRAK